MKKFVILFIVQAVSVVSFAQIDKDKLALAISKADDANTEKLKEFIWKRKSEVFADGKLKLTTITEFSFDQAGKLQAKLVDAESSVEQKRGIRGRVQQNAIEDKVDYVGKALELSLAYTFMTKGQLMDFLSKATVAAKDGITEIIGNDVYVKGDKLTIHIDSKTYLYLDKEFSSFLDKDPIDGKIKYEKFSSGVSHGSLTLLNMPTQKMKIDAANQDYTQRVK